MNCRTFQQALNDVFSRSWEQDESQPWADNKHGTFYE